jgi:hypothetical protein
MRRIFRYFVIFGASGATCLPGAEKLNAEPAAREIRAA